MKLYNTLSRKKEEFVPRTPRQASVYSCGPTVYNFAHIGNLRTYVFMDLLRRVLEYNGFALKHVMNITDVGHLVSDGDDGEDKMVKGAREQKKTPWEIAAFYTDVFMKDIEALNVEKTEIVAKATEHIEDMIAFIEGLLEKGYAYSTGDGIYFDIQQFEGYGKLSRIHLDELLSGARVEVNEEKRHPADFALWKKAPKEHIMQWESPWGMGYPGWHIECSAMSRKYLGDTFDIHTGGVDHIPIHHENEIAQSEGLLGHKPVNYWLHGEFMLVNNGKMSKSLGNTYTLEDLARQGITPMEFRFFCLNAHYRNKLNFTWEAVKSSKVSYERFLRGLLEHKSGMSNLEEGLLTAGKAEFEEAINDDLNIPKALGVAWNLIRHKEKSEKIYSLLVEMDRVFGLSLHRAQETLLKLEASRQEEMSPEVAQLVKARQEARAEKNWKRADEIRDKLKAMGIGILDSADGVKIVKL